MGGLSSNELESYLSNGKSGKRLTRADEARLASRIRRQRPDSPVRTAAINELLEYNLGLVIKNAKQFAPYTTHLHLRDLIQEGNFGLRKAAEKFDERLGHKFSTYATWWIRQAIRRAIALRERTIYLPADQTDSTRYPDALSLDAPLPSARPDGGTLTFSELIADRVTLSPFTQAMRAKKREHLERLMATALSPREQLVTRLRFGLDCPEHTLLEVGKLMGVTRERVRQIGARALWKLRHRARTGGLHEFLEQ